MMDFLGRLFSKFVDFMNTLGGKIVTLVVAPVVGLVTWVYESVSSLNGYFNDMIEAAVNAQGNAGSLTAFTGVGIANYFVPLDTMFICAGILVNIFIAGTIYRAIKSWIPTVS